MNKNYLKRGLALLLSLVMVFSLVIPVSATEENGGQYRLKFTEIEDEAGVYSEKAQRPTASSYDVPATASLEGPVRVSIVLESASTIDKGYSTYGIALNRAAVSYRAKLQAEQEAVTEKIEKQVLGGDDLDVVWNLTLAANIISANVDAEDIEAIKNVPGVKDVVVETLYLPAVIDTDLPNDPNMATSSAQIGTSAAWASGYTGAGSKIAIIDTGLDLDHKSFNADAFDYAIGELDDEADLLTEAEVAALLSQLNIAGEVGDASALYVNSKVPFAYNYVDGDFDVTHDNDSQGEHGSHVAGIAAANKYIKNGSDYENALETVYTQGVAPDAQIITMKVFGKGGGAYDSDYMVAIEDAIVLGADSINLSLGSSYSGYANNYVYADILNKLAESDSVVTMSAGNSSYWAYYSYNDAYFMGFDAAYLYGDDVNFDTVGSPASYTNSLAVASVNNIGSTAAYITVDGNLINYYESYVSGSGIQTLNEALGGKTVDYVFVDAYAEEGDFDGIDVEGKVVIVWRGLVNFTDKGNRAAEAGAAAVLIANNTEGIVSMVTDGYDYDIPYVSITLADGLTLLECATDYGTSENGIDYYTGTLTVSEGIEPIYGEVSEDGTYEMSYFSSWGVPGTLELKPEITAPGGSIYSVDGSKEGGEAYEVMSGTSMAAPQVAGMAAVLGEYIRENDLVAKTGYSQRQLINSLLMATAVPVREADNDSYYYSVMAQGSGLANVGAAVSADGLIIMDSEANAGADDGKVKVELGEDADKTGAYDFSFEFTNISEQRNEYTLSTEMFTQGLFSYYDVFLDTWTVPVNADVTYYIDGEEFIPDEGIDADVDMDGDTDSDDAVALLNYILGNETGELDLDAGDVDGDGDITTYDAHLILAGLSPRISVEAGETVTVGVHIELDTAALEDYVNGAYVEGFTFVEPVASEEGALDVTYSIPIFGFYGSWSDPSMFDRMDYIEYYACWVYDELYGYISYAPSVSTGLSFTNSDTHAEEHFIINPANDTLLRETFDWSYELGSIRSSDVLNSYYYSLIRDAGAVAVVITDADGNIVYVTEPTSKYAEFYYDSADDWYYTAQSTRINKKVGDLFADGDTFTVYAVAVPELYTAPVADENGNVSVEAFLELLDVVGDGAFTSTTLTVDDEKPLLLDIAENDEESYTLVLEDNIGVSAVWLCSDAGTLIYDYADWLGLEDGYAYAPELSDDGAYTVDIPAEFFDDLPFINYYIGSGLYPSYEFIIKVEDYAHNVRSYVVDAADGYVGEAEPLYIELPETLEVITNSTTAMPLYVYPDVASPAEFDWTSDNEAVITVDGSGNITALSEGVAVITATYPGSDDPYLTSSCVVTVTKLEVTATGVLADDLGYPRFFEWNFADGELKITGDLEQYPVNIADVEGTDYFWMLYGDSSEGAIYLMSKSTGEIVAGPFETPYGYTPWAMTYTDAGLFYTYGYYLFGPEDPTNLTLWGWNFSSYGYPYFLGLASVEEHWEYDFGGGEVYSGDIILYAVDDYNYVWEFYVFETEDGYSVLLGYSESDLPVEVVGYDGLPYSNLIVGDDGALYYSMMTGDTNEVYRLVYNEAQDIWNATFLGDVGYDVWPALLFDATSNSTVETPETAALKNATVMKAEKLEIADLSQNAEPTEPAEEAAEDVVPPIVFGEPVTPEVSDDDTAESEVPELPVVALGSLNAIVVGEVDEDGIVHSENIVNLDANTVTVNISLTEGSPNGRVTIKYDPSVLTLDHVVGLTEYYAFNTETVGEVKFDYASADELFGQVATVVFTYPEDKEEGLKTEVEIDTEEDGDPAEFTPVEPVIVAVVGTPAHGTAGNPHQYALMHTSEYHWFMCTVCNKILGYAKHSFQNGYCSVCNYYEPVTLPPARPNDDGSLDTDSVVDVDRPIEGAAAVTVDETVA